MMSCSSFSLCALCSSVNSSSRLEFKNITKRFPGVLALDNVSLSIERGLCHALIGENGAGKSTLGKILAGILAHCKFPFHTSLLEGINNKIKVIKRMAYGYRDHAYFFLKIRVPSPEVCHEPFFGG